MAPRRSSLPRVPAEQALRILARNAKLSSNRPVMLPVSFRGKGGAVGPRDEYTHWIHWYPAKMLHHIPREILRAVDVRPGGTILDPFCGSGTVLLESALLGYEAFGVDTCPLARLITEVKTTRLKPSSLEQKAENIVRRARRYRSRPDLDHDLIFWFKPEVMTMLHRLVRSISEEDNPRHRKFFLVCLSSIVRRVSLADPSIPPPVKLNPKRADRATARYRRALRAAEEMSGDRVRGLYCDAMLKNIARLAQLSNVHPFGQVRVLGDDFEAASTGLPDQSVDLIISSPPYCGAQKYVRSLRLEMIWLGLDRQQLAVADKRTLGTERVQMSRRGTIRATGFHSSDALVNKIEARNPTRAYMLAAYVQYLNKLAKETRRILRNDGALFYTFGTGHIAGIPVDLAKLWIEVAEVNGLDTLAVFVDTIPSRGLITKRHSTAGTINDERIVWMRRKQ